MTADDYYNLTDITRVLSERHGYRFDYHNIPSFVEEINRRCTPRDQLYPLVDFLAVRRTRSPRCGTSATATPIPTCARDGQVHLREPALTDTVEISCGSCGVSA